MDKNPHFRRFQRVIRSMGGLTLAIYAIAIFGAMIFFRQEIRHQILHRDGALLSSIAQHFHAKESLPEDNLGLINIAIESSEIGGVIGVRLYSPDAQLLGKVPASLHDSTLSSEDLEALQTGHPITRYFESLPLDVLFLDQVDFERQTAFPVTEVLAPVQDASGQLVAIIQYWLDGQEMATELARLDRFLAVLGCSLFIAGSLIFSLVFLIARARLLSMGLLLTERNRSLEKANAELAMAAKTSAIGSVTSHLFHGLKNPLAGLKAYLQLTGRDEEAVALANRIQSLIDEALSVIRDEETGQDIELSLEEFKEMAQRRFSDGSDGKFVLESSGHCEIPANKAQLLLLVLRNLLDNAIEASPNGSPVIVRMYVNGQSLHVEVDDKGPGLPESIKQHLFEPVQSPKENGAGIGLAISAVLARHIPASLQLLKSTGSGTTFSIQMPL